MSLGGRLKEERERLGFTQSEFAALAGATKGAQQNWEKDEASPKSSALQAWIENGLDAMYVLTGKRLSQRPVGLEMEIEEELASIRRELIDPSQRALPDEDERQAEERIVLRSSNRLKALLAYDRELMDPDNVAEAEQLLEIADNPAALSLVRAADRAQQRKAREDARRSIGEWLEDCPYCPGEAVTYMLVELATEYLVPTRSLASLIEEIDRDLSDPALDATDGKRR